MATTVQEAFRDLKSNLEITDLQVETVSIRQNRIRDVLKSGMTVKETFLTGSYARSTMISPLSRADIDVFCVLDTDYFYRFSNHVGGPASLLDHTKETLLKTYTNTPSISRNGQAVTVRFTDFVIDVVVAFYRKDGGYIIPNSITNSWLSTDPKRHVALFSAANQSHNGSLVPIIKMLKSWNRSHGSFFRSFHLEVLALQIFSNVAISDFPSGVRYFFDKARDAVKNTNPDPAGFGDDVGKYIDTQSKVGDALHNMQSALNIALRAEEYNLGNRNRDAIEQWRRLFPDHFPRYG